MEVNGSKCDSEGNGHGSGSLGQWKEVKYITLEAEKEDTESDARVRDGEATQRGVLHHFLDRIIIRATSRSRLKVG